MKTVKTMTLLVGLSAVGELFAIDFAPFSDLEFAERYAFSTNRTALISELKRGTQPWFFYGLLNLQTEGRFDEAKAFVKKDLPNDDRNAWHALQLRQMFCDWTNSQGKPREGGRTPDEFLAWDLQHPNYGGIEEPHCVREVAAAPNTHPSVLNPAQVSFAAFSNQFAQTGRYYVDRYDFLPPLRKQDERRFFTDTNKVRQPNEPGLIDALVKEFGHDHNTYRSCGATANLTIAQLEELRRRGITANEAFIQDMLKRLEPNADEDVEADLDAMRRWLDRVHAFVMTLGDDQGRRKLESMRGILELERSRGNFAERELFLAYLKQYVKETHEKHMYMDDLAADYLAAFRRKGDDLTSFKDLVSSDDLKRLAAETDLMAGVDQAKVDLSGIGDEAFRKLRDKVEITWFAGNPRAFAGDADVALEVDVKNVKKLRVAVYELDAFRALVRLDGVIKSDIDLDGCVPTCEETRDYSSVPAIVRHRERLALAALKRPGVYVVECSGAGVSSRAVVRKGALHVDERVESCGHVFTVRDEKGAPVKSARLRLGETTFASDETGEIAVPFADAKSDDLRYAIVGADNLAMTRPFKHRSESYALQLDAFLPPEALVAGREATAVLSFGLKVADAPASLTLLQDPQLDVTFTDLRGVSTVRKVENLRLTDDGEYAFAFTVPPQLATVRFDVCGKVRNLSKDRDEDVKDTQTLSYNTICSGRRIEQAFLRRDASGYSLELRGRNGEPLAARELQLQFAHRVFCTELPVTLQTDAQGVVRLGPLTDIDRVRLTAPFVNRWNLAEDARVRLPSEFRLNAGETLAFRVPGKGLCAGKWPLADDLNAAVSLVAVNRANAVMRDCTSSVALRDDGLLVASGLPVGKYRLYLRGIDREIKVCVVKNGQPVGNARRLYVREARLAEGRKIAVTLGNASPDARVHLVGRRFVPQENVRGGDLFALLARMQRYQETSLATSAWPRRPLSTYISGRDLGDKLRYILDRRNLPHRPGNMLERPSLLLNPWSVSETRTDERNDRAGEDWEPPPPDGLAEANGASHSSRCFGDASGAARLADAPSYDFLAENGCVWINRRPNEKGEVRFELPEGLCDFIVVATDGEATDCRSLSVASVPAKRRDLRARAETTAAVRTRTYADLRSAYELIRANGHVEQLDKFAFITRWPSFSPERQRELYGEYACHELDVFLSRKDPKFFDAVIRPSLRNKRRKDFIDLCLLGDDLSAWTKPSAWQDLNAFERCLLGKRVRSVAKPIADQLRLWCEANPLSPGDADRYLRAALGLGEAAEADAEFGCAVACGADELAPQVMKAPRAESADKKAWSSQNRMTNLARGRMTTGAKMGRAVKRRAEVRQLYRPPETTREWVETYYYQRRQRADARELAPNGRFWRDYAAFTAARDARFLPESFAEMVDAHSLAEAMVALAVLDLPFEAKEYRPKIVYSERPAGGRDGGARDLSVVQRIVDVARSTGDSPCYETEEFVVGRLYWMVTVVSNPTERRLLIHRSKRIPDGAIALAGGSASACDSLYVDAYSTSYDHDVFYFPAVGKDVGKLVPASVSVEGELRGVGAPFACHVVEKSSREDRTSWQWISQNGTDDQVIAFLETANLASADVPLAKIGWRMRDDAFARRVYDTLSRRGVFNEFLWKFALFGRYRISDFKDRVRELLMSQNIRKKLAPKLGPSFHCPLIDIEPEESDLFEYSEFWPLINARAHTLGGTATIANESLKAQYRKFLDTLATHRTLSARDRVDAAVYLIAQDRVDEAKRLVAGVRPEEVQMWMQLDYLHAYFAFSDLKPEEGRKIALKYADWPVPRWRERFRKIIAQADEIAGRATSVARSAAAEAPSLELTAEAPHGIVEAVIVKSRNVTNGTLRAYRTDVEVTFSKAPFGESSVKPASSLLKPAWEAAFRPGTDGTSAVRLPESLKGANLVLEATDGDGRAQASLTVLSGSLEVQVVAEYGELRVRDRNGRPLAAAYVKVYAQDASGQREKFHKDGYTDLRGAFEYASVSTDSEFRPDRFAILVQHDTEGVRTLVVKSPQRR